MFFRRSPLFVSKFAVAYISLAGFFLLTGPVFTFLFGDYGNLIIVFFVFPLYGVLFSLPRPPFSHPREWAIQTNGLPGLHGWVVASLIILAAVFVTNILVTVVARFLRNPSEIS